MLGRKGLGSSQLLEVLDYFFTVGDLKVIFYGEMGHHMKRADFEEWRGDYYYTPVS